MNNEPDIKQEVSAVISGVKSNERKWLLIHKLLNKYKASGNFCEIRRRICRVMIDQERQTDRT